MSWLHRVYNTLRSRQIDDEIRREAAFHVAERADQLRAEGVPEYEAKRRAQRQFGNLPLQAERTRDMNVAPALEALLRDVRYAGRSFRRTPGFTLTVILTLALGIGANSAVFSALDAVLLRPLPFPNGDRLVQLLQRADGSSETNVAPVRIEEWQRMNTAFTEISGYYTEDVSETSGEFAERLKRALVAPRFIEVWGIPPAIGRGFTIDDHRVGSAPAILVSHRYWRDRLGSDPRVLDRTVRIGRAAIPIVGVMPESFLFPDRSVDLFSPVPLDAPHTQSRRATWYFGVGRLKDDVTIEQARANLATVQQQLGATYGDVDVTLSVSMAPLKNAAVGDAARRSLWLLFGGVSILLLIACTNIASLLLSRAAHRQHEVRLRVSLGASQLAVARQLLIETLVLSIGGAGLGLLVAVGSIRLLRTAAIDLPRIDEIAVDWRIVAYTFGSAVIVALLCGLVPAIRAARDRRGVSVSDGSRAIVSTRYSLQWLLVGAQVALSVTLLAGAVLLGRGLQELWRVDSGFNLSHVLAFRMSGSWSETTNRDRFMARIDGIADKLRSLPGVESVATTGWALPGVPQAFEQTMQLVEAQGDQDRHLTAEIRTVSPEYFPVMQIPVIAGELCHRRDGLSEVMVNQTFANRYFGRDSRSPIGFHVTSNVSPSNLIVGIVADARERGLDREPGPVVYSCSSAPTATPYFLVRTRADPATLIQPVRSAMKELDPGRAVYELGVLEAGVAGAFAQSRMRAMLLTLFAATALALASVGVYGTLSYAVSVRRREVALRLALGAVRASVLRQFLFEGLRIVGVGCLAGLGLTIASARLITGMLYGVSPNDPVSLAVVLVAVVTISAAAALIPAFRASRVDAMVVLRDC